MIDDILLPFAALTTWLAQFRDDAIVGYPQHVEQCPIACCLRACYPNAYVTVTPTSITILQAAIGEHRTHTPALWLTAIIEQIDALAPMDTVVRAGALRAIVTELRRFCDEQMPIDRESVLPLALPACADLRAEVQV